MVSVAYTRVDQAGGESIHPAIDHALSTCGSPFTRRAEHVIRVLLSERRAGGQAEAWQGSPLTGDGFPFEIAFSTADDRLRFTVEPGHRDLDSHQRLDLASELIDLLGGDHIPADVLDDLRVMQSGAQLKYGAWVGCRIGTDGTAFKLYAEIPLDRKWSRNVLPFALSDREITPRMIAYTPATREFESYVRVPSLEPCHVPAVLASAGLEAQASWLLEFLEEAYGYAMRGRLPGPSVGVSSLSEPATGRISLHFYARALWGSDARIRRNFSKFAQAFGWDPQAYLNVTAPLATRESWCCFHGIVGITLTHFSPPSLTIGLRPVDHD